MKALVAYCERKGSSVFQHDCIFLPSFLEIGYFSASEMYTEMIVGLMLYVSCKVLTKECEFIYVSTALCNRNDPEMM
jgi:hypothetical protein